ncbi:MAG: HdeD family acid-resistance protein [Limisphaerales bacterium]
MNGNRAETGSVAGLVSRNWWVFALRGLAAIIFGVLAWVWPGMTLLALVYLFGIYAIVFGILSLVAAGNVPKGFPRFGNIIFSGLLSIAAGVIAFVMPGLTAMALLFLIAFWAIVTGITEITAAIRLRKILRNEWWLALVGVCSVVFGLLLIVRPGAGALAVLWWIGTFAIIIGALLIAFAFEVRGVSRTITTPPPAPA